MSPGEIGAAFKYPDKTFDELVTLSTQELDATAKVLGVKEVRVLRYPDSKITNTPELRLTIVDLIREFKPDLVITHWPEGGHPDVRETGQAVTDACFFAYLPAIETNHPAHQVKKLYAFSEIASVDNFNPDIFIDISDVMDTKIEAIRCNEAMIEEINALFSKDDTGADAWTNIFLRSNRYWGQESGVKYAEPFKEIKIHGQGKRALQALPV
jgi:LmbE family N-acetylglucosaminyl deacetylase